VLSVFNAAKCLHTAGTQVTFFVESPIHIRNVHLHRSHLRYTTPIAVVCTGLRDAMWWIMHHSPVRSYKYLSVNVKMKRGKWSIT